MKKVLAALVVVIAVAVIAYIILRPTGQKAGELPPVDYSTVLLIQPYSNE